MPIIFTAALASLGLIQKVFTRKKRRKINRVIKQFFNGEQKLSTALVVGLFVSKKGCCSDCIDKWGNTCVEPMMECLGDCFGCCGWNSNSTCGDCCSCCNGNCDDCC